MYPGSLPLILMGVCRDMKNCSMYAGVQCTQVFNLTGSAVVVKYPNPSFDIRSFGNFLGFSKLRLMVIVDVKLQGVHNYNFSAISSV